MFCLLVNEFCRLHCIGYEFWIHRVTEGITVIMYGYFLASDPSDGLPNIFDSFTNTRDYNITW